MTWFKVDDGFAFHHKAITAGNAALGLWVRAGSWCAANLTEGALPKHMVGTLGAQKRDAAKLVAVGLWCETEDGYQFNDWSHYQPTKDQVEARKEADRERQRRHRDRLRHGVTPDVTGSVTPGVINAAPTRPDPSSNEEEKKGARKRATQAPSDFVITDAMREWAVSKNITGDLTAETERFLDHHRSKGSTFKDWAAAWRTWMSRAGQYAGRNGNVRQLPATGERLSGSEVERILGPDYTSPPKPPANLGPDEAWEWQRRWRLERIEQRQQQARERLAAGA